MVSSLRAERLGHEVTLRRHHDEALRSGRKVPQVKRQRFEQGIQALAEAATFDVESGRERWLVACHRHKTLQIESKDRPRRHT